MTPAHRRPGRLPRRAVLGLAGLAAIPAATVGLQQWRSKTPPAEATTAPPVRDVPAVVQPSATPKPRPVVTSGGGPVPFRPGKALLGSYLDLNGMSAEQALALRRQQTGRDQRIVHVFYGWTDTLPHRLPGLPDKAVPMVSWRGTRHEDILNGSADALIARAARRLIRFGRPVLLRWGWEMNGSWYAWGGARNGNNPGGYVESWRRLHGIFAEEGATNVSWVWSTNWNNSPNVDWNKFQRYYPGDRYVDWVGVSGYNLHRELPGALFRGIYDTYSAKKPIMISEVGSVDRGGRTKADWIERFAEWVEQHPAVGAVAWFDTDTHPGYHERWRVDTDAASLAAYREMARSPRFAG
ncbi:glycoside hydrolase family 26 protein [Jidongwangia harbinensis]|uniref:glycoside hydrolase family 26 protein n=1 Tax=Jidongwangia harbinensis TaxID=2878561 RepID=UPI001CDA1C2D|nr:glycosyl hydrolase [Jidongwangia harbinensis]MCA2212183.1 hypothetical protein [Jidongwangia harbinensis]